MSDEVTRLQAQLDALSARAIEAIQRGDVHAASTLTGEMRTVQANLDTATRVANLPEAYRESTGDPDLTWEFARVDEEGQTVTWEPGLEGALRTHHMFTKRGGHVLRRLVSEARPIEGLYEAHGNVFYNKHNEFEWEQV